MATEKYRGFDREHTKAGKIEKIYNKQKAKSKERGHEAPQYSKFALIDWAMSQELYHTLFDAWAESGWETDLAPSIDRKDDTLGYSFDNIQVMVWRDNRDKLKTEIEQRTKSGELVASFSSVTEASDISQVKRRAISNCLNGWSKTAGGYTWLKLNGGV